MFKMAANEIQSILDEAKQARLEASGGVDLSKPQLKPGGYLLQILNVKAKKWGNGDNLQIVVNCNLADSGNENFRDLLYTFNVMGDNDESVKIGRSMLVEFLNRAFKYVLQPCNDENELINQISKHKGKPFQAAVRTRDFLSTKKDEGGEQSLKLNTVSEIWYTGSENEEFNVDPTKLHKELSDKDKARYAASVTMSSPAEGVAFAEAKPAPAPPVKNKPVEVTAKPDADDDLPF